MHTLTFTERFPQVYLPGFALDLVARGSHHLILPLYQRLSGNDRTQMIRCLVKEGLLTGFLASQRRLPSPFASHVLNTVSLVEMLDGDDQSLGNQLFRFYSQSEMQTKLEYETDNDEVILVSALKGLSLNPNHLMDRALKLRNWYLRRDWSQAVEYFDHCDMNEQECEAELIKLISPPVEKVHQVEEDVCSLVTVVSDDDGYFNYRARIYESDCDHNQRGQKRKNSGKEQSMRKHPKQ